MTTLNEFLNSISAEAYTPSQSREGCIIIINVPNSKRFKLSKEFAKALGDPTAVDMYFTKDTDLIFLKSMKPSDLLTMKYIQI